MTAAVDLASFPRHATDKLRYGDTDRQGHINNAVFATLFETGRVEIIHSPAGRLAEPGCEFVLAHLAIDFRAELTWPGDVTIGTRITSVGRSSVHLAQALFQHGRCAATAATVIVQMDLQTRRSRPLSPTTIATLQAL